MRICEECGHPLVRGRHDKPGRWRRKRFCSPRCAAVANGRKGAAVSRKAPGEHKPIERNGYIMDWVPGRKQPKGTSLKGGRYVYRHRLIMEDHLGRELDSQEIVHHVNGDRQDNRLENLRLTDPATHQREHVLDRAAKGAALWDYPRN